MSRLLSFILCFVTVAHLQAADGHTIQPRSVELETFADPPFGAIVIHASASKSGQIETLVVGYRSKRVEVPPEGLRDLKRADISSLRVSQIAFDPAKPSLLLTLNSWDPTYVKNGRPAIIEFSIKNGRVVHRAIFWSTDGGAYHDDKTL